MTRARMDRTFRLLVDVTSYSCARCGGEFASKAEKSAHKPACDLRRAEIRRVADAEWAALPEYRYPVEVASAHLASLSPERREQHERDW